MYTRYGNEYTKTDVQEENEVQAQRNAEADAEYAEMRNRAEIIVSGLQSKYGFSEKGANHTLALIEQQKLDGARFATKDMETAAKRAYEFYWK